MVCVILATGGMTADAGHTSSEQRKNMAEAGAGQEVLLCVILITMAGFALYFLDRISVSTRGELLTDDKCHLDVRVRKSITWLAQMNCFLSRAGPLCRAADVYHTAALPQRARSFGFPALRPSERVTLLIQLS